MNPYICFIQISEMAYDDAFMIERFVQQLPPDYQVVAFTNGMSSAFVASRPERIVGVLTENQENNLERFRGLLQKTPLEAVIVLDLHQYFLKPEELNFLPVWLTEAKAPIFALDYFNLLETAEDRVILKPDVNPNRFEAGEEPLPLDFPITLLKPIPPILPEDLKANPALQPWNPIDYSLRSAQHELREQVRQSFSLKPDTRLITVIFDPTLLWMAMEQSLLGFFFASIEVLVFYLRQFQDQHFQILVVGSMAPGEVNPIPDLNVEIQYFTHLTEDNYRAFMAASDLIIANNNWSLATLDAMTLGTPLCVLGNSVIQDWKDETESEKTLTSFFKPHPVLYELAQLMIKMNEWTLGLPIFQYINYPLRYKDPDFPQPGLQKHAFPYYLLDMFDDESTQPILQKLLFSESFRQGYAAFCADLLKVSEQAESLKTILEKHRSEA
ncbi:MAG: hypothetical protein IGS03_01995 [Candidatus Sericytochromatia bacterium]|nr:hypothetical protein [Candidatus Sericytochromatia bacterium]